MSGGRNRFPTDDATRVLDVRGHGRAHDDDDFDVGEVLGTLDDRPGPARRLPSLRTAAMVRDVLDRALQVPASTLPLPGFADGTHEHRSDDLRAAEDPAVTPIRRAPARPMRGSRRVALLAAALVVAAVGGASAAVAVWVATPKPAVQPAAPAPARTRPHQVRHEPPPPPPPAPALVEDEPLPPEELAIDMPAEVVQPPRSSHARPSVDRELPDDAPAEDVLALANQRRKEKRWRDADALYQRVMARYAHTDAAVVANVASAALHLDRLDDPAGALRLYRRSLRLQPSGPLAEEARWGLAEAQRALGDVDAEAEALRSFLGAHADSANATAARRRLSEIAADPIR